jgi:hypothetical protein
MDLQCFITEHLDSLPTVEFDSIHDMYFNTKDSPNYELKKDALACGIKQYDHSVFEAMNEVCVSCFNGTDSYAEIYHRTAKPERNSKAEKKQRMRNMRKMEAKCSNEETAEYRKVLNTLLADDKFEHAEDFYSKLVNVFSRYLMTFFAIDPSMPSAFVCQIPLTMSVIIPAPDAEPYEAAELDTYGFKMLPAILRSKGPMNPYYIEYLQQLNSSGSVLLKLKFNVFKTRMVLKSSGKEFVMYYATYKMPKKEFDGIRENPHYAAEGYKVILNILPADSKMSQLGLNEQFINAGIYVNKLFEYATGQDKQIKRQSLGFNKLYNNKYQFSGDLLTQFWPLNELHEAGGPEQEPMYLDPKVANAANVANVANAANASKKGGYYTKKRAIKRKRSTKRSTYKK